MRSPEAGFSRPKLSPKVEAGLRDLTFDPLEAYYGFRRVKAAFRSGDVELLSRVAHYPLTLTGKTRRTIRNRKQLVAAKDKVLNARIREVVAKATFATVFVQDKGVMLGGGEVWIIPARQGSGSGPSTCHESRLAVVLALPGSPARLDVKGTKLVGSRSR